MGALKCCAISSERAKVEMERWSEGNWTPSISVVPLGGATWWPAPADLEATLVR